MMGKTKIEWAEATWSPVTGCTKISAGCQNCYAERMAKRLQAMGNHKYRDGFKVTAHPEIFNEPLKWKKPSTIFVCSMGDLFHDDVVGDWESDIFYTMRLAYWHTFLVLTKRPLNLRDRCSMVAWPSNIWAGTTVEDESVRSRIEILQTTDQVKIKFLSCEPLLSPLENLNLKGLDLIIVGGESGPGARPMKADWVRSIRDQCIEQNVSFFFKGWGGVNKKKSGRILDGQTWDEMPKRK